jgi:predicted ribosome quality control (RQC) complex YloA/Tae2 family protein
MCYNKPGDQLMGFDGFFFWRSTELLREALEGATMNRVFFASDQELVFLFYQNHQVQAWVLSLRGHRPYFTIQSPPPALDIPPTHFLQLLRHHVEGSQIKEISGCGSDRILRVVLDAHNDFGVSKNYHLYLELTGKITNLILTKADDSILDVWHRSGPNETTKRTLMPGALYRLPPLAPRKDPRVDPYDPSLGLAEQFHGFSPLLAHEFEYRMQQGTSFHQLVDCILQSTHVYWSNAKHREYHYLPLTHLGPHYETFPWAEGIAKYHQQALEAANQAALQRDLLDFLKKEDARLARRQMRLMEDLEHTQQAEQWRQYAEIIYTYGLDVLNEKRTTLTLEDEQGQLHKILLDPTRTVGQNANRFFQKAQKARKAIPIIAAQQAAVTAEQAYYEQLRYQLEEADATGLEQMREELRLLDRIPKKPAKKTSKQPKRYPPLRFHIEQVDISVGRNNLQNEYVTFTLARNEEWFFHVQGYPGSHVLLHTNSPTEKQIQVAASLAAYFSKARASNYVSVEYTQVRNVLKLPGGFPGAVLLKTFKTIQATPQSFQEKKVR